MNFPQFWAKAESGDFARSRRCNLAFIGLAVIPLTCGLALPVFGSPEPSEPEYQGLPLREWLAQKSDGAFVHDGVPEAIRQIGTNTFPTLLQMLRAQDSPLKLKVMELSQKQHFTRVPWVKAEDQQYEAYVAFSILEGVASNAVPGLIKVYNEKVSDSSQMQISAIFGLLGTAADAAVPALTKTLANTNASSPVRCWAGRSLGFIYSRPKLVVPLLIHCLNDPDHSIRFEAALALWQYGKDAKAAIPSLKKRLKDRDAKVREYAAEAIKAIENPTDTKVNIQVN